MWLYYGNNYFFVFLYFCIVPTRSKELILDTLTNENIFIQFPLSILLTHAWQEYKIHQFIIKSYKKFNIGWIKSKCSCIYLVSGDGDVDMSIRCIIKWRRWQKYCDENIFCKGL